MAWNGLGKEAEEEERGLELSLGLPGYFVSRPPAQEAGSREKGGRGGAAKGSNGGGFKTSGCGRPPAAAPVVGWPPVRSFRRNLASSSSCKQQPSPSGPSRNGRAESSSYKGLFVKVNMDGVPIGRKVDLKAHGSYGKLSAAVNHLFQGLLAAQRDPAIAAGQSSPAEKHEPFTGLLDCTGEYTLVYEDDEGDQMLAGDVPWDMFIATAKRLRVLRSSDLNASSLRAAASRTTAAAEEEQEEGRRSRDLYNKG